jgi:ketosteroid isomerase-like protein
MAADEVTATGVRFLLPTPFVLRTRGGEIVLTRGYFGSSRLAELLPAG